MILIFLQPLTYLFRLLHEASVLLVIVNLCAFPIVYLCHIVNLITALASSPWLQLVLLLILNCCVLHYIVLVVGSDELEER